MDHSRPKMTIAQRNDQMILRFRRWSYIKIYYEKELGQFEAKLKNTNYANEEEEYRAKMIPQQIDETKAALKDTEDRLSNGKRFLDFLSVK